MADSCSELICTKIIKLKFLIYFFITESATTYNKKGFSSILWSCSFATNCYRLQFSQLLFVRAIFDFNDAILFCAFLAAAVAFLESFASAEAWCAARFASFAFFLSLGSVVKLELPVYWHRQIVVHRLFLCLQFVLAFPVYSSYQ